MQVLDAAIIAGLVGRRIQVGETTSFNCKCGATLDKDVGVAPHPIPIPTRVHPNQDLPPIAALSSAKHHLPCGDAGYT